MRSTTARIGALAVFGAVAAALAASQLAAAAPANDSFSSAIAISGASGTWTGTNVGATRETGEPVDASGGGATVWWRFTSTSSRQVALDTRGSSFDTILSVYTGSRVRSLTLVARNDNAVEWNDELTSRLAFTAAANVTYWIQVDGRYGATGSISLTLNRPAPANDAFAAAQAITGTTGNAVGTTLLATSEPGEPVHRGVGSGNSIWYRWTAPAGGVYRFDTVSSAIQYTTVAAYSGTLVSSLSSLGGWCTPYDYRCIEVRATAGQTMSIAVDGTNGGAHAGQTTLHWVQVPSPANDAFASAQQLSGLSGDVNGTTTGATSELGEPGYVSRSVWYRFTPAWSGPWSVTITQPPNQNVYVYTGSSLGALQSAPSTADYEAYDLTAGVEYRIQVDGSQYPGPFTLHWAKLPPENDAEFDATYLGSSGTLTEATPGATKEPGEPNHAGNPGGASVWFYWNAPAPGTFTIDTTGSDFDTLLAVYRTDNTPVASDDDSGGGGTSRLFFHTDGATNYYIAVDGKNGAVGHLTLTWSFRQDPPPNDAFASSTWVSGLRGYVSGRNGGASKEPGEPAHTGNAGGASVWYRWTAPRDGLAVLDTYPATDYDWGPTFDTMVAAYTGASVDALTEVGRDDPTAYASRLSFPVTAGTVYRIAVDGKNGATGTFQLNWDVGPPNDDYATAQLISGAAGVVRGTTDHATYEVLDDLGQPDERYDNGNVWYRWRAPATGTYAFRAPDSVGWGRVDFYTGVTLATAVFADVDYDATTGTFFLHAVAGAVYRISVVADSFGAFELHWSPATVAAPPRPANDDFAAAQQLSGASGVVTADVTGATIELGEPVHDPDEPGYGSVWYRWTAPFTGEVTFDTTGSAYETVVAIYGGIALDALEQVTENVNQLTFGATTVRVGVTAGDTLVIAVARGASDSGTGNALRLSWSDTTASAPANDNVANAQSLTGSSGSVTASNAGGSRELGEPWHGGVLGGASLWYAWTAPAAGAVSFATQSSLATELAVYRASDGTLVRDDSGSAGAYVAFTAAAGAGYLIAVDTASAHLYHIAGTTGSVTLTWRQPPTPPNDAFANAVLLNPYGGVIYAAYSSKGDNFGATKESGEPNHAGNAGGASVWYRMHFDYPYPIGFTVSTTGSDFDTVLAVYTGSNVASLTPVAADDDSGGGGTSRLAFTAPGGTADYSIAVDGKNGATGHVVVNVGRIESPPNDHFHEAAPISGASGSVSGDLAGATVQSGEPTPHDWPYDATVWYRWSAPATGTWHFATTTGAIGVYTGTMLRDLVENADTPWSGRRLDVAVVAGGTYWIAVDAETSYGYDLPFTLSWRQSLAPANDLFGSALPLSGSAGTVTQSNDEASVELGEPLHAGAPGGVSLWYTFTAPGDGTLALDTLGSSFDTVLGVYTGSSPDGLHEVASSDDYAGSTGSGVRVAAAAGTTYRIAVDDALLYNGDIPANTVVLHWSFGPPPANDSFASAAALSGGQGSVSGTTVAARAEPGEPPHGERASGASVWYAWTAPATGNVTFSLSTDGLVAVYRGTGVDALTVVRRSDDGGGDAARTVTVAVDAASDYRIAVDGLRGETGPFALTWNGGAAPANDAFSSAQALSGASGTVLAATDGATKEAGEPDHAGDRGGASVWFTWRPSSTGVVAFDTLGSGYDTLLGVYTGDAVGALTPVTSSNDADGLQTSGVRFLAEAGTTYRIALDGAGGASGNAVLHWYPSPTPPNDTRAHAELIGGRGGWTSGTTMGSTDGTVWYAWTAPGDGTLTLETNYVAFATTVAVYRGSTLVAQDVGKASLAVTAGETLVVAVSGANGARGAFQLQWREPPANDDFAAAQPIAGESGTVTGTTEGAGVQAGEPESDYDASHSVWYRWTAPATGTYAFDSTPAGRLLVCTGASVTSLVCAGGRFGATAGTTYYLDIDSTLWKPAGDIRVNWRRDTSVVPNDVFAAAQALTAPSGTVTQVATGAAREPGEPYLVDGSRTLWYRWTAPASGRLTVDTFNTNGDTSIGVFTGTSVAALAKLGEGWGYCCPNGVSEGYLTLDVTAGTTYLFDLSTYGSSAQLTWRLDTQVVTGGGAPGNDMFANAFTAAGQSGSASGSNVGATKEAGEPNHAGNAGGHSVWWKWTAPVGGLTRIDTYPSSIDTLLAVYTGTAVNALTLVAQNDDDGSTAHLSSLTLNATAGVTYRIAVDGKNGLTGPVGIDWSGQPADTIAPDTSISSGPTSTTSSTTAVFQFSATETGVRFECSLDAGAWLACTPPQSYSGLALGGHTFQVRAIDAAGNVDATPAAWSWRVAGTPGNDAFAAAATLSGLQGQLLDSSVGATRESGEPGPSGNAGSVWYRWTAQRGGTATFRIDAADVMYTAATIYTGSAVSSLTPVTTIAPGTFVATAGATYSIQVDGPGSGSFRLSWRDAPANDDSSRPAPIAGASGTWTGDNVGATKTEYEPAHGGDPGGASVWLTWTAPASGTLSLDTLGSDAQLDTLLAVYTQGFGQPLTLQAQDNDSGGGRKSALQLPVFEGTTYLIALDGFGGATGNLTLNWRLGTGGSSTAPTVALTSPADGARVSGSTVVLAADASDPSGIDRVEFVVDGQTAGAETSAPYTFTWDSTFAMDGAHTVSARAVDTTGEQATSAAHTVWVDNTPPYVTIDSGPSQYGTVASSSATFSFHSEVGATFECRVDGAAFAACTSPTLYSGVADGQHSFEVHAIDRWGTIGPSQIWTWTVASGGGGPDTTITDGPTGAVTSQSATFSFTSPSSTATFECALDGGAFAACTSPKSYGGLADGNHAFQVRAVDSTGTDATPASRTWTVDTTPPDTTITGGPSGTVTATSATFTFTASESGTGFQCSLDGSTFADCTSPQSYSGLAPGTHTFQVRALDFVRNEDPTPAAQTWTIAAADTTPPETTIDAGPAGTVASASASFAFSASEAGSSFQCQLDGAAWSACSSPQAYSALPDGPHSFGVRATDAAGNTDATPATRSWTVDTAAPDTTISSGPSGTTTSTSASFAFTASEAGAAFECRLDGTAWSACTSPQSYSGLAVASHTFDVRARDAAGNVDATPASRTWTIASAATNNDNFANAAVISGANGTSTGSTAGMTKEAGEPNHAGNAGGHSIWYRWTAPNGGTVTIDTIGSNFDTLLGVYTGTTLTALMTIASNDDASGTQSRVTFTAVSGTTYSIAVDGYGGATGSVTLNWSLGSSASPANDMFASVAALTGASGTWTGSNTGATKEPGEPNHAGNAGGHSLWFSWTAPAGGATTFKTAGSAFDTLLAVYTGSALSALTQVAANDDADGTLQSRVAFTAAAGTTYRIAVDGYGGSSGGVTLAWSQP